MLDGGPLGKNVCYANCMYTHYGASSESLEGHRGRDRVRCCHLLTSFQEAWKVTVVVIECKGAAFLMSFQEGPHQKLFFQGFFQNSAS